MFDEQAADLFLSVISTGSVCTRPFSDVDAQRLAASQAQDIRGDQSVVEDYIGAVQEPCCPESEEAGSPGPAPTRYMVIAPRDPFPSPV